MLSSNDLQMLQCPSISHSSKGSSLPLYVLQCMSAYDYIYSSPDVDEVGTFSEFDGLKGCER